ncbi:universal stress protein [uncultured Desulfobacter sp.]|uniref:universal stress protein n=1 Tax=uncultured Desulfobacter sp. TaxID=240139 RepID=UPI002AAAE1C1|nr:universal stress protein [uncultured Desulfobacter sp.]
MTQFNHIMACIDLSDYSPMTLGYALDLAGKADIKVTICSIVPLREVNPVFMAGMMYPCREDTKEYLEELKTNRIAQINELIRTRYPEFDGKTDIRIKMGYPAEEILAMIDEIDPDLVVMANKGRSNLSSFMFGSSAEFVFRHCRKALFSVRDKHIFKRMYSGNELPESSALRTIIAAVDFSPWTEHILARAGWVAKITGAKLHVYHCIGTKELSWIKSHYMPENTFSEEQFLPKAKQRRRERLEDQIKAAGIGEMAGIEITIDSGDPCEQILSAVKNLRADALVLGPLGHSRSVKFVLGSTIEKIFRHSPVPVLRLSPDICI